MDAEVKRLMIAEANKGIRNVIIFEFIWAIAWNLAGRMFSDGTTLMAVVNIFFLLISLWLSFALISFLRIRSFSSFVSGAISALVWVSIFGIFRGLF